METSGREQYNEIEQGRRGVFMSWLSKLERKWGKYAIPNITLYLIICYAFGYVIELFNSSFLNYLTLNPYAILHGQVWRLLTWIVVPPEGLDLFTLVMLYFYFSIGTTLERTWGTFRYNVYLIGGMLLTIVGAFLFYGVCVLTGVTETITVMEFGVSLASFYGFIANYFSTYYVCMSIILAFAATFPDVQVLFMFIIPLKIKVLGIIYAVILGVQVLQDVISLSSYIRTGSIGWYLPLADMTAILFSLLAFIIFFVTTRKSFRTPQQIKRQRTYHKQVMRPVTKHKCAICGRTDESDPDLVFRFCSKCDGNYEYCQDHIFTHKHVKKQ